MGSSRTLWSDLAAAFSLGAALVHAAAAGTHGEDTALVVVFAGCVLVQGAIGVALLRAPSRAVIIGAAAANLACLGGWVASRTVGLPLVGALAAPQALGWQDVTAAALATAATAAAVVALGWPKASAPTSPRLAWVPVLALVPALVGVAAPHEHDDRGHGPEAPTIHGSHEAAEGTTKAATEAAIDPVLVGADTSGATEAELGEAVDLVERTRAAVDPGMDVAAVEAAGYVWIGDGRRPGRFQHYVNHDFLSDGRELDPAYIESFVFENTDDGPVLVSTMYLLEMGDTMADRPEVGGELTVWHDHQNLCWDETGTRLAGISTDGVTCRPAGELRATPPMLHVWLADHECGPFAGIEGHGSETCASHGH